MATDKYKGHITHTQTNRELDPFLYIIDYMCPKENIFKMFDLHLRA